MAYEYAYADNNLPAASLAVSLAISVLLQLHGEAGIAESRVIGKKAVSRGVLNARRIMTIRKHGRSCEHLRSMRRRYETKFLLHTVMVNSQIGTSMKFGRRPSITRSLGRD